MKINHANRVLWFSVFFAVFAHVMLLFFVNIRLTPPKQSSVSIFTVRLAAPPKNIAQQETLAQMVKNTQPQPAAKAIRLQNQLSQQVFIDPTETPRALVDTTVQPAVHVEAQRNYVNFPDAEANVHQKSAINMQMILDQASQIALEEARESRKELSESHSNEVAMLSKQDTASAAIGKAFKQVNGSPQQKVVQYAGGMVEITTVYGTKYCVIPPKDFERGGPVEASSIPMTCP